MKREEAIWWVNHLFEIRKEECFNKGMMEDAKEAEEAQHMAIEALSAEPTDLISRADAEAFVCMERCGEYRKDCPAQTCPIIEHLDSIPSADRPSGEWKERDIIDDKEIEEWQEARCSVCGKWHTTPYMYYFEEYNYCPNCGAKMGATNDQM